jgi:sugar lactone lactonase YvrE
MARHRTALLPGGATTTLIESGPFARSRNPLYVGLLVLSAGLALLAGSLWVTGRGTDLLRVDPETGAVQATIEIGTGGIDVAAAGGRIWVANASDADDRQGLPVMQHLYVVNPATNTISETLTPTGRLVVDGLATDGATLWIADVSLGRLYRIRRG